MNTELILSIVLAASTVIYTIINAFMLYESRETLKQKITPLLVAYLKSGEDHLCFSLWIKNVGEGLAKDVTFHMHKDYKVFGKDYMSTIYGPLKYGVNSFPSGHSIQCLIDSCGSEVFKNKENYIEIEISYLGIDDTRYSNKYTLPFNQIPIIYPEPPESYMGQIAYHLKSIAKTIEKRK